MPLSEEELRLLEQMERALVAEDPKLASTLRGTTLRRKARHRSLIAGLVFVAGVAVLMTGAVTRTTIVGIIGFVVMLVSAYAALVYWRGQNLAPQAEVNRSLRDSPEQALGLSVIQGGKSKKRPRRGSGHGRGHGHGRQGKQKFMDRLEERWQRRRDQNGL